MIRRAIESLTATWCFERSLRVGSHKVPMVVSAAGGLRYLFKPLSKADPLLVSMAEQFVRPGDVVWDVGANLGLFAFPSAALAGTSGAVFAFEPDPWLIQVLRRSARRQSPASAPVRVIPVAAARDAGIRSFTIAKRSRSSSHLSEYGLSQAGGALETLPVVAIALDWALGFMPPPRVLKIDVEGAELEVLHGASALIRTHRPVILCEVSEPSSGEVTEFLHSHGYRLIDGESGLATDKAPWSTIALHSSP